MSSPNRGRGRRGRSSNRRSRRGRARRGNNQRRPANRGRSPGQANMSRGPGQANMGRNSSQPTNTAPSPSQPNMGRSRSGSSQTFGPSSFHFDPNSHEATTCAICRNQINQRSVTNCQHSFCHDCISRWMQESRNCPICRTTVYEVTRIGPGGRTELFRVSKAELVALKVNDIHSVVMMLFMAITHTILPEVVNHMNLLNEVARELNVNTTNSRWNRRSDSDSDSSDGSELGSSPNSTSPSDITMRSPSPSASSRSSAGQAESNFFVRMVSPRAPAPLTFNAVQYPSTNFIGALMTKNSSSPVSDQSTKELSQAVRQTVSKQAPCSQERLDIPMADATESTVEQVASKSIAEKSVKQASSTNLDSPRESLAAKSPVGSTLPTSTGPEGPSLATKSPNIVLNHSRTPPTSPTVSPSNSTGQQQSQSYSWMRSSSQRGTEETIRMHDIVLLREAFDKVNQVYEPLMFLHMIVHRNQIDTQSQTTNARDTSQ